MANGDKKSGSYFQPFREITIPFETRSKTSSSEIITSVIGQINNEFRKIYNRLFSRRVDADLIKASNGLKPMKFEGAAETKDAKFDSYIRYVLTNDNTLTWEDIVKSMLSSVWEEHNIEYCCVYTEYINMEK